LRRIHAQLSQKEARQVSEHVASRLSCHLGGEEMGNRIGLFASVVLAGTVLAATSSVAAPAAEECIAKPNGQAPAGKHWYYRTNRELKKKCWYLADEGEKTVPVAQASEKTANETTLPVAQAKKQPITEALVEQAEPATSDARAELIDEPKVAQPAASVPRPQVTQPQILQPQASQSQALQPQLVQPQALQPQVLQPQPETSPAASESAAPRNWTMASRWSDASSTGSTDSSTVASAPTPAPRTESRPPVVIAAAAAEPAEQPAAAVSDSDNYGYVFAGAILAVIAGGAMVMFLGRRNGVHVLDEQIMVRNVRPRLDASSFARPIAASPASMPSRGELRDEIEQLLETSRRQARA
jgi:hypothetical protein